MGTFIIFFCVCAAEQMAEGPWDIRAGFVENGVEQALYFGEKQPGKPRTIGENIWSTDEKLKPC